MRITIIIAAFNAARCLSDCLDSIWRQTYADIEVLVVDAGSTDGSRQILERYAQRCHLCVNLIFTWISEPDDGIADAWNKGILRSTGEWILFLGADDTLYDPEILSTCAQILIQASPLCQVVYGGVAMIDETQKVLEVLDRPWKLNLFLDKYLLTPPHQGVFTRRIYFDRHGNFDTALRYLPDYDLLLRGIMVDAPLHLTGIAVARMKLGGISNDRRHSFRLQIELTHVRRRYVGKMEPYLYWLLLKAFAISSLAFVGGDRLPLLISNFYRACIRGKSRLPY